MPLAHLKIGGIMSGRNFDDPRTEFEVDQRIFDEWNFATHQRKDDGLALVFLISFVFRIDSYGRIAQHRFRPRSSDFDEAVRRPFDRIFDVVELRINGFVYRLEIGQSRVASRTPIDQALAAIDQPFFIQADKNFADCAGQSLIQSEPLT